MNKIRVTGYRISTDSIRLSSLTKNKRLFPDHFTIEIDLDSIQQREKGERLKNGRR